MATPDNCDITARSQINSLCTKQLSLNKGHPYKTAKMLFPKGGRYRGFHCIPLRVKVLRIWPASSNTIYRLYCYYCKVKMINVQVLILLYEAKTINLYLSGSKSSGFGQCWGSLCNTWVGTSTETPFGNVTPLMTVVF